jgi:hypothetical protein
VPRSNRFLVVVRAGDQSLHPQWTSDLDTRDWDLVVSYFGDDPHRYRGAGETRIDDKGVKFPGLYSFLTRNDTWRRYDYILFPDDDLAAEQASLSALFAQAVELKLSLAQPALSWSSYYSHRVTVRHPSFRARWTNFIEGMAPCFERGFLETCLHTFGESQSGWGLDWVWPRLLGPETRRSAIIDAVTVTHTRPVGGPLYTALRKLGVDAATEGSELMRRYGMGREWPPKLIAAIDARGTVLEPSSVADAKIIEELLARDWSAFLAARVPPVVLEARFTHSGPTKASTC